MQVFISWSKQTSHELALALYRWLPEVIQRLEPWMSTEDISKGQRWSTGVEEGLDGISEGLVCVTRENMMEPWLNYEAGALAKSLKKISAVRPILLDMDPSDITGPLAQFQATVATDKQDMLKLAKSLNISCDSPLKDHQLARSFDRTWREYLGDVQGIMARNEITEPKPSRKLDDMLGEVVVRVRNIQQLLDGSPSNEIHELAILVDNITMHELRELAKILNIEGGENMRKLELIDTIRRKYGVRATPPR